MAAWRREPWGGEEGSVPPHGVGALGRGWWPVVVHGWGLCGRRDLGPVVTREPVRCKSAFGRFERVFRVEKRERRVVVACQVPCRVGEPVVASRDVGAYGR